MKKKIKSEKSGLRKKEKKQFPPGVNPKTEKMYS